jgi:hypothetical protein
MPMLEFQTALRRLARTNRDTFRSPHLGCAERECLDTLRQSAGIRFTAAVQRSWSARRAVNTGLLALSILQDDARRRLLATWINAGGGTSSFFASEADALLDFIAEQLPDPSPELAVCRFEQLTLRANKNASSFKAPDGALFGPQRIVRRAAHAGVVCLNGEPDFMLSTLLRQAPFPAFSLDTTALLVAPGSQPLCRSASAHESELWNRLSAPSAVADLLREGYPSEAIETMLHIGALEYA